MQNTILFALFLALTPLLVHAQKQTPKDLHVGIGARPVKGAKVYFDGSAKSLHANWTYWAGPRLRASLPVKWAIVPDPVDKGTVMNTNDPSAAGGLYGAADLVTKDEFRDFRVHVEFCIPDSAGNSGVYLQNRFEIQVLDGDSSAHGMAAIINERPAPYHLYAGRGQWNAYDIVFRAARFRDGKMVEPPTMTMHFNGKKVHLNQHIERVWGGPNSGIDGGNNNGLGLTDRPGGLKLQAEGHNVLYRNIWIQPLDLQTPDTDLIEPGTPECTYPVHQPRLLRRSLVSKQDQKVHEYFVYLPKGHDGIVSKRYPVLMFLHGHGERGNGLDDLDYVLAHGPLYEAWIQKRDLPFIIISPQLPMYDMDKDWPEFFNARNKSWVPQRLAEGTPPRNWGDPQTAALAGAMHSDTFPEGIKTLPKGWFMIEDDLLTMLDDINRNYFGDQQRTYLTGLSYGGFGTWHFASTHPERFAAIAPVVGWGHPDYMQPIADAKIPVWAFAGGLDFVVQKPYFYAGLNKLKSAGKSEVRFTIHEDMGHDAWRRIYGGQDLYDWLLSYKKP
jgi:pimeloyl-ACP methyl ester carboxylesterase